MDYLFVSIVIPTYNRKDSLKKTIISLANQTYPKDRYEVIVCDDGSSDGTSDLVAELASTFPCDLSYMYQKNQGASVARNMGIRISKGTIIGFTDDDCIVDCKWIENSMCKFITPHIGGVQGATIPAEEKKTKILFPIHTINITEEAWNYPTCNMFYRKDILLKVGCFNPIFLRGQDTDLAWKVKNHANIIFSRESLVYHAVEYKSIFSTLKSLKTYEYDSLLYKTHPELKSNFLFGFIWHKQLIYPIFIFLSIVSLVIYYYSGFIPVYFGILFFAFGILTYLYGRVFIRKGTLPKYAFRTLALPYFCVFDSLSLYHILMGNLKYKCFVI